MLAAGWVLACAGALAQEPAGQGRYADPPMPPFRVEAQTFKASEADIKAICGSAGREFWKYFPEYRIDPLVVVRDSRGPKTLFARNAKGEIVIWLNTAETYWCQYAYQFAHEFCHVLCGFDEDWEGNKWFEETLCETASLFALRAMSKAWETDAPYPNWKGYRVSLAKYAQDVIEKREKLTPETLAAFYEKHRAELIKEPCQRDLNGAMAVVLLEILEAQPESWEAVRWLNSLPSREGETFRQYLEKWHGAVPEKHRAFVRKVAGHYGIAIQAPAEPR
jgi:hypothetical protein